LRTYALTIAAAIAAVPASAEEPELMVDLHPGHTIYHENEREAGVVMAISITADQGPATNLQALCEELRLAAGLQTEHEGLPLEVVFVVPYKGMAIEGYYLPADAASGSEALVRGKSMARATLDGIVARAGIPGGVLDEAEVEQELSCEVGAPAWLLRWEDVRLVGSEAPDTVIDHAYRRFMTVHQSIVEHATGAARAAELQAPGLPRLADRASP
jgi:hypothetical protein